MNSFPFILLVILIIVNVAIFACRDNLIIYMGIRQYRVVDLAAKILLGVSAVLCVVLNIGRLKGSEDKPKKAPAKEKAGKEKEAVLSVRDKLSGDELLEMFSSYMAGEWDGTLPDRLTDECIRQFEGIRDYRKRLHVLLENNDAAVLSDTEDIDVTTIEERIAGNTAGILIKKDIYDKFIEKYKEATVGNVLDATLNGDLIFAYTNPYTSSTGLNILTCMLKSFDENDPLSETASEKLLRYQQSSPPVAYTTAVLRNSAAKGVINAMVMEEQAYVNTPELKGYVYVPAGIRHDHPVYTFDWDTEEEVEAAKLFTEYCKSDAAQKLATEKGFNRHDEYEGQDTGMTGTDYLNAQKVWKQNKNGGKPILAVFVADVSGSMDGTPINSLKSSLVNALPYISEDHYIGLVSYSGGVTVNLPIEKFDPTQRAYFSGEVKNLSAGGQTATYDALLVALKMLEDKAEEIPDAKKMVFLLTDGAQNQGYTFDRVEGIVEGLQVPVYSIAYNYSGDGDLEKLSGLVEASVINSSSDDIANQIRNLFNVNL